MDGRLITMLLLDHHVEYTYLFDFLSEDVMDDDG